MTLIELIILNPLPQNAFFTTLPNLLIEVLYVGDKTEAEPLH